MTSVSSSNYAAPKWFPFSVHFPPQNTPAIQRKERERERERENKEKERKKKPSPRINSNRFVFDGDVTEPPVSQPPVKANRQLKNNNKQEEKEEEEEQ